MKHSPLIFLLIQCSAYAADYYPSHSLVHAAEHDDIATATRILHEDSQAVCETDIDGRTALHNAAGRGSLELVELLIMHGAEVNAQDEAKKPPIWYACYHPAIFELLLRHNADTVIQSRHGNDIEQFIIAKLANWRSTKGCSEFTQALKILRQYKDSHV